MNTSHASVAIPRVLSYGWSMRDDELEDPEPDVSVGERVKSLRERAKMSQDQIAMKMREAGFKWSNRTVWQVETGSRPLRLVEAEKLVKVLDVPEAYSVDALLETDTARGLHNSMGTLHRSLRGLADALTNAFSAYGGAERELIGASFETRDHDRRTRELIALISERLVGDHPLWATHAWLTVEAEENSLIDKSLPRELGELLERHRESLRFVDPVKMAERERYLRRRSRGSDDAEED